MGLRGEPRRRHRPGRPDGRGALQLVRPRRAEGRGQLDHRGHRPGPHHRQPRGADRRLRLSDPRRRGRAPGVRPDPARGPVHGRLVRDQCRRRHPPGQATWGPGNTIVTILCDYGSRYQSKLFNPAFLASGACPSRPGCERHRPRPDGLHRLAGRAAGRRRPGGDRRHLVHARRRRATRAPNTPSATSPARNTSTSTRCRTIRAPCPTCCPSRPTSRCACAAWGSSRPRGWWSTTPRACSRRPGSGGCSGPWAMRTSSCSTAAWPSGSPRRRPVEAGWMQRPHGEFKAHLDPDLVRDLDQVRAALAAAANRCWTPAPPPASPASAGAAPGPDERPYARRAQPALAGRGPARRTWRPRRNSSRFRGGRASTSTGRSSPPAAPAFRPRSWPWPWRGSGRWRTRGLRRLLDRMGRAGGHARGHRGRDGYEAPARARRPG